MNEMQEKRQAKRGEREREGKEGRTNRQSCRVERREGGGRMMDEMIK